MRYVQNVYIPVLMWGRMGSLQVIPDGAGGQAIGVF